MCQWKSKRHSLFIYWSLGEWWLVILGAFKSQIFRQWFTIFHKTIQQYMWRGICCSLMVKDSMNLKIDIYTINSCSFFKISPTVSILTVSVWCLMWQSDRRWHARVRRPTIGIVAPIQRIWAAAELPGCNLSVCHRAASARETSKYSHTLQLRCPRGFVGLVSHNTSAAHEKGWVQHTCRFFIVDKKLEWKLVYVHWLLVR